MSTGHLNSWRPILLGDLSLIKYVHRRDYTITTILCTPFKRHFCLFVLQLLPATSHRSQLVFPTPCVQLLPATSHRSQLVFPTPCVQLLPATSHRSQLVFHTPCVPVSLQPPPLRWFVVNVIRGRSSGEWQCTCT